mgnify:CR=1 FL=1
MNDFGKIFESGGGFIIVPNENLAPEKTITGDVGIVVQSKNKRFKFENTSTINSGTYFVVLEHDGQRITRKIMKN